MDESGVATGGGGGPLRGIRVLDLSAVVLGPFATQTLGDWGAEVIKVEPPAGDLVRASGVGRHPGMASVFLGVNRNKRSLCLDLKAPEGAEVLRRLIPRVDALVSNIRPAGMARLGFGWEQCAALNPRLVYAVATGFGQDGPHRARPAFDEVIQAASGLAAVVGGEDGPPAFVPSPDRGQDHRHGAALGRARRAAAPGAHGRGPARGGADAGNPRRLRVGGAPRRRCLRPAGRSAGL